MLDRASERISYPFEPLILESIGRVLCVAPHPDDEALGCGGLLARLVAIGGVKPSLILTQGEGASDPSRDALSRMDESFLAAKRLGLPKPEVLDLGDRRLRYGEVLVSEIERFIAKHQVQTLLLPSLSEPHPDHQACALAGLKAAVLSKLCERVLFYEVGSPMQPNRWVDIDAVAALKWFAIEAFESQLSIEPYLASAKALSQVRATRIPRKSDGSVARVHHAEAFFEVTVEAYRKRGVSAAVPHWPWLRFSARLANDAADLPEVAVLIRSMNRPSLLDTLASVASQTYRPIHVIIVNASARPLDRGFADDRLKTEEDDHEQAQKADGIKVTIIDREGSLGRNRAQAANRLLKELRGLRVATFAMFLDDDDVIDADHVERLVLGLQRNQASIASYTGVRVVDCEGRTTAVYDKAWSMERLMGINFIPIHGLMFRVEMLSDHRLEFDETLPVLEDWEFWQKLARQGPFTHIAGVSASYRQHLGESKIAEANHPNYWKHWHKLILDRSLKLANSSNVVDCLAWHAIELDERERQIESKQMELQLALTQLSTLDAKQREVNHLKLELETTKNSVTNAALAYERELARLQHALQSEALEVVSLQAKLQEVSELSRKNFDSAEQAHALVLQRQGQIDTVSAELKVLGEENRRLINAIENIQKTKLWKFGQVLRRITEQFSGRSA